MAKRPTGSSERVDWPIALVIGTGGMGLAVARRLGQRHRLVLASLSASKIEGRQETLRAEGHDVVVLQCDITDEGSVAALARFVSSYGPLRTLAHVAALSPSMADWRTILRVNLVGPALIEKAMLPLAGQGTAAVFVSSNAAYMTIPESDVVAVLDNPLSVDFMERLEDTVREVQTSALAYHLSKFALNRMCRRFAARWGRKGARIVSMSPGLIATPYGCA